MNILGIVRNGGEALRATLERIELLRTQLADSRVIIATNDNSDDTGLILEGYSAGAKAVEVLSMDGLATSHPDRVDRICHARNEVLRHLFSSTDVFPTTLVLDLDGPNEKLDTHEVLGAMSRNDPHWDAVFGNPQPSYYDLYALRCTGWCDEDVWQRIHAAKKPLFFRKRWRRDLIRSIIHDRQYRIPVTAPLIPVKSAFGGLALYRTSVLDGLKYSSRDEDGNLVCEHVLLHNQMRARGARLFIDPSLTTLAPAEHLGDGSGAPLPDAFYSADNPSG